MKAGCIMSYPVEMNEKTFFMMTRIGSRFWMRSKYMPDNFHKEIPQHRALGKSVDPEKVLEKVAGILNCDLDDIRYSQG